MPITLDGTLGITTPSLTTGSFTNTGAENIGGNLTFTSTGARILADMSNATISNRLAFQTSTTNGQTVVGIIPNGTSTATQLQLFSSPDYTNYSRLAIQNTGSLITFLADYAGTGSYLPVTFNTGGSERMRIDTSGRVQIGTTTATGTTKLVVADSSGAGQIRAIYSTGLGLLIAQSSASGNASVNLQDAATLSFATNNSDRMYIDSSGNVGIGTNNPSSAGASLNLVVSNASSVIIKATSSSTTTGYARYDWSTGTANSYAIASLIDNTGSPYWQLSGGPGVTNAYYDMPTHIWRNASGVERMRIDSSGNVGIGTSSPSTYGKFGVVSGVTYFGVASDTYTSAKFGPRPSNDGLVTVLHEYGGAGSGAYWKTDAGSGNFSLYRIGVTVAEWDSSSNFKFNSGYGSAQIAYGCRAWVRFNGSNGAITGSGGVSSVTRSSTGVYVVNFSFTFPDTNYATFVTDRMPSSTNYGNFAWNNANTTNVTIYTNYNGTVYDAYGCCVSVFR